MKPRITPHQFEVLLAYHYAGATPGGGAQFGDIWTHMGWEDRINSTLQMKNFDRAVDALERKGLVRTVHLEADGDYPELTEAGVKLVEEERARRRAQNVR